MLEHEYRPGHKLPFHLRTPVVPEHGVEYAIRNVIFTDLPAVREIYNHYVTNSTVTFDEDPLTLPAWHHKYAYLHELGMPFIVAESPRGHILGYAYVSPWKQKRAYRFTVENSIYLGTASTGKGLGPALLAELLTQSTAAGLKEILAVIADSGAEASLTMHKRCGFKEIGRMGRVGYKFDRWIGTIMLQKSLT
jgi:L-amino acid N-acyltransferase YncA